MSHSVESGHEIFGPDVHLTIVNCQPEKLTRDSLLQYAPQVSRLIGMKLFGQPVVGISKHSRSGHDTITVIQLWETSNSSVIADIQSRKCYVQIFTCKQFDEEEVLDFTEEYFGGQATDAFGIDRD